MKVGLTEAGINKKINRNCKKPINDLLVRKFHSRENAA